MAVTYKPNPNKTPQSRGTYPSSLHHHRRIKENSSPCSRCMSLCHRAAPQWEPAREGTGSPRRPLGPAPRLWLGVGRSNTLQPQRLEQQCTPPRPAQSSRRRRGCLRHRASRSSCRAARLCIPMRARRSDIRPSPSEGRSLLAALLCILFKTPGEARGSVVLLLDEN